MGNLLISTYMCGGHIDFFFLDKLEKLYAITMG